MALRSMTVPSTTTGFLSFVAPSLCTNTNLQWTRSHITSRSSRSTLVPRRYPLSSIPNRRPSPSPNIHFRPILPTAIQTRMNFTNSISYPGQKTAAAIIIGNEILSGKFQDTNTFFLAKTLYQRGVKLKRVETIMDDMEEIGEAVRRLSAQVDYVFTSGGIGPTLDDITYEAIAKAFNLKLVLNDRVVEEMERVSPQHELNPARLRMATLPETSELLFSEGLWVPIAVVNSNVHILPGVPWIFERMMNSNKSRFGTGVPLVSKIVYTNLLEGELSASLDTVAGEFPSSCLGVTRERAMSRGTTSC